MVLISFIVMKSSKVRQNLNMLPPLCENSQLNSGAKPMERNQRKLALIYGKPNSPVKHYFTISCYT